MHKSITRVIIRIFQEYASLGDRGLGLNQYGNGFAKTKTPSQQLDKYFFHTYPYLLKDRIRGATRPRKFYLVTNTIFLDNIKHLALTNAMTPNEFANQILSHRVAQLLNNDPMLFTKDKTSPVVVYWKR